MADAVEKVLANSRAGNNRYRSTDALNRCCVLVLDLESMLRASTPKIFFRQHRPKADIASRAYWLKRHRELDLPQASLLNGIQK